MDERGKPYKDARLCPKLAKYPPCRHITTFLTTEITMDTKVDIELDDNNVVADDGSVNIDRQAERRLVRKIDLHLVVSDAVVRTIADNSRWYGSCSSSPTSTVRMGDRGVF